jgi:Domain of unknown function (DUF4234)
MVAAGENTERKEPRMTASPSPQATAATAPSPLSGHVQLAPGVTAKIRGPIAVAILSVITLGIYIVYWWYSVNRELADYGRARNTKELGDNPMKSTLAVFPGVLLLIPALWTGVTTIQRIQTAQRMNGQTPINGWLSLVLYLVIFPALFGYMQSGLNSAWRAATSTGDAPAA